ncbi:MAG: YdeI/OmpD-associated family protein [Gammaproteobacteria bacterium]|nr:YdeI/OmpD-associated family protein [Gammaproteobacteria bacterium]
MVKTESKTEFEARLLRPAKPGKDRSWAFVVLPRDASAVLPRRGRTTVDGTINGRPFRATLEPDGQLSHWLRVEEKLRKAAHADIGDNVTLEIMPVEREPDPDVPADLDKALAAAPNALASWSDITTIARLDWIHWIVSAKRPETRARRIENACDMLASGKRQVCCFDPSGYYSKSFHAPEAAE